MKEIKRIGELFTLIATIGSAIGLGVSDMRLLFAIMAGVSLLVYLFLRHKQWQREDEWITILAECHFKAEGNNIVVDPAPQGSRDVTEYLMHNIVIHNVPETAAALRRELRRRQHTKKVNSGQPD